MKSAEPPASGKRRGWHPILEAWLSLVWLINRPAAGAFVSAVGTRVLPTLDMRVGHQSGSFAVVASWGLTDRMCSCDQVRQGDHTSEMAVSSSGVAGWPKL